MIVPGIYRKIFNQIIEDKSIIIYILSIYLKINYKIIEANILFKENNILFNNMVVKITLTDYINSKKINSTKFKYLEINFVKNYNTFFEKMIHIKSFDNVEIHYINLDIVLRQIYNKTKLELNSFERFIILITSSNRDEIKSVVNDKYLYKIYKKIMSLNNKEIRLEYKSEIKEVVDFDYYKQEFISEIRKRLIKYLDSSKVEEVLEL